MPVIYFILKKNNRFIFFPSYSKIIQNIIDSINILYFLSKNLLFTIFKKRVIVNIE